MVRLLSKALHLLPILLWSEVQVHVRVSFMDQIKLYNHLLYFQPFNYVQINDYCWIKLLSLQSSVWNL